MTMTSSVPAGVAGRSTQASGAAGRRVTDAPTRMFHGLFALAFLGAYLTADGERWRALHVTLGYTMAGLLAFRLAYGLFGPRPVRLGALAGRLAAAGRWAAALWNGGGDRMASLRQAPTVAMGLAMVLLLLVVAPLTLSGYATFHEWASGEWLEEVHEFFGNAMLVLVLAHLGLILLLSIQRRRNMALPMLTGRAPGPGPDLVGSPRRWLATLLLLAVLGYGAWEWQQAPHGLLPGPSAQGRHGDADD